LYLLAQRRWVTVIKSALQGGCAASLHTTLLLPDLRLRYTVDTLAAMSAAPRVLSVRPYSDADRPAWDDFVLAAEGSHPAQLGAWLDVTQRTYGVPLRAWLAERGGAIRGVLPLFEKRSFASSPVLFSAPGGALAEDAEVSRALLAAADEARMGCRAEYVEIRDQRHRWPISRRARNTVRTS
jgi:hypothetical protein